MYQIAVRRLKGLIALAVLIGPVLSGTNLRADNYTCTINAGEYRIVDLEGGRHLTQIDEFGYLLVPGKPMLSARVFLVAVPPGVEITSVTTTGLNPVELPGRFNIKPAPPHLPSNEREDVIAACREEYQENLSATYATDAAYPSSPGRYLGTGALRKYSFVRVSFCPFAFSPQSGTLVHYPSLQVSIDYQLRADKNSDEEVLLGDAVADQRASQLLVNYEQARDWYVPASLRLDPQETYDYVIITRQSLISSLTAFVEWKESLGFSINITSVADIEITYSGFDLTEKIRNFLSTNYLDWSTEYVLLVGGIEYIPMRQCFPDPTNHDPWSDYCPPTDHYYADLTGDWDSDGDGFFGELNEDAVDFVPEVIVGRIPFNDSATVASVCNKLIAFESDTSSWKNNALLLGAMSSYANQNYSGLPETDGAVLMELMITDMLTGWSYTTMYEKNGIDPSTYACDYPLSVDNVYDQWISHRYGIVNWWAHGSDDAAWSMWWDTDDGDGVPGSGEMGWEPFFTVYDAPYLDAGHPAIVFSCSCDNGDPEVDCLAKALLQCGSAGMVASTRVSWFIEGWGVENWGGNASIDYHFFKYLINEGEPVGDALFDSKTYYYNNLFWGGFDYDWSPQENMFDFCLFGDPSLVFEGVLPGCCGLYTGGYTGNANCSEDGKMTLSDVSRLIDHVFISKESLCCEENGNVNGSLDEKITLSDISRLIDHVFISKEPTEPCL